MTPSTARSELLRQRARSAQLFLIPMIIALAIVAGWPLLRTIYFSFTDASLTNMSAAKWMGFKNYLSWIQLKSGRTIFSAGPTGATRSCTSTASRRFSR